MSRDQQDGAGRLKRRFESLLAFIAASKNGRHTRECEGYMLRMFGLRPKTTTTYLEWAERYGEIAFTNVNRNKVKKI